MNVWMILQSDSESNKPLVFRSIEDAQAYISSYFRPYSCPELVEVEVMERKTYEVKWTATVIGTTTVVAWNETSAGDIIEDMDSDRLLCNGEFDSLDIDSIDELPD